MKLSLQKQIDGLRKDVDALKSVVHEKGDTGAPGKEGKEGKAGATGEKGERGPKGRGIFS